MKIKSARFVTSSSTLADCPGASLPEVAFIGRSNVGKSSLLNFLCQQRGLAKTSGKPGHTRTINFFAINDTWCAVDLPGYGYAKVSKTERARFSGFTSDYLEFREALVQVYVLIDSRHEPQRIDVDFTTWLVERGVPFSLVFTKTDKVKPGRARANRDLFLEALAEYTNGTPATFFSSTENKEGREEILTAIAAHTGVAK